MPHLSEQPKALQGRKLTREVHRVQICELSDSENEAVILAHHWALTVQRIGIDHLRRRGKALAALIADQPLPVDFEAGRIAEARKTDLPVMLRDLAADLLTGRNFGLRPRRLRASDRAFGPSL